MLVMLRNGENFNWTIQRVYFEIVCSIVYKNITVNLWMEQHIKTLTKFCPFWKYQFFFPIFKISEMVNLLFMGFLNFKRNKWKQEKTVNLWLIKFHWYFIYLLFIQVISLPRLFNGFPRLFSGIDPGAHFWFKAISWPPTIRSGENTIQFAKL